MEGEDAALLDIDALGDVGDDLVVRRVADEPRIAVDDHEARVLGAAAENAQRAAVFARAPSRCPRS